MRRSHACGPRTAEHHICLRFSTHVSRNSLQAQKMLAYLTAVFLHPLHPVCVFSHHHPPIAGAVVEDTFGCISVLAKPY